MSTYIIILIECTDKCLHFITLTTDSWLSLLVICVSYSNLRASFQLLFLVKNVVGGFLASLGIKPSQLVDVPRVLYRCPIFGCQLKRPQLCFPCDNVVSFPSAEQFVLTLLVLDSLKNKVTYLYRLLSSTFVVMSHQPLKISCRFKGGVDFDFFCAVELQPSGLFWLSFIILIYLW